MNERSEYSLRLGLLIGVLGGLVIFIWSALEGDIHDSIYSAIIAFIIFTILGFVLGILIYHLE